MAPTPSSGKKAGPKDLALGAGLQMAEAATLGMPFEVWKTRMGRNRSETTVGAFKNIYNAGGVGAFYKGLGPKMVESATKGAVLLLASEVIKDGCKAAEVGSLSTSFIAGAGGGVAQVVVMGPMTYLVTAAVTSKNQKEFNMTTCVKDTMREKGIKGFYPGGSAIAFRQVRECKPIACRSR